MYRIKCYMCDASLSQCDCEKYKDEKECSYDNKTTQLKSHTRAVSKSYTALWKNTTENIVFTKQPAIIKNITCLPAYLHTSPKSHSQRLAVTLPDSDSWFAVMPASATFARYQSKASRLFLCCLIWSIALNLKKLHLEERLQTFNSIKCNCINDMIGYRVNYHPFSINVEFSVLSLHELSFCRLKLLACPTDDCRYVGNDKSQ